MNLTLSRSWIVIVALLVAGALRSPGQDQRNTPASQITLRPPATPLVACDPYFSIWSFSDQLHGGPTRHWTGREHPLTSLLRVDGRTYRVMGDKPGDLPVLNQTSLEVWPTRTIYRFAGAGIELTLTFLTPALPEDANLLSRPVTYLTWSLRATDDRPHETQLYFDASGELCVNQPRQRVEWETLQINNLKALKIGSTEQPVLAKKGDDLRIDWGYLHVAAPTNLVDVAVFAEGAELQRAFAADGLPGVEAIRPLNPPTTAAEVRGAVVMNLGPVGRQPVSRWLMLAYDDLFSIQYMHQNLRPYWRRNGWEASDLLTASAREHDVLADRCAAFDRELMADLTRAGGERYAKICALAYRQCFAASKFVADANGQLLSFSKENFSNGCIGTADVFYPMSPQFLLFGPSLAKSFLVPFMNYAASERWRFPFAPHDLGTYPHANGQVYGGGEHSEEGQMPVEESANLLILMAAVAQLDGHAEFAARYWPQLQTWAAYLKDKGFDPPHQLCTDDFAGPMAHNVNLSAKAICALAAFAKLCGIRNDTAGAAEYSRTATDFAARWIREADDGDHFRLSFDRPGTWSQKYNLVWDRILNLGFFPDRVFRAEMDHYRRVQNRYGLPLDSRATYTKLDWILWSATLTRNRSDFEALINPVFEWLNSTPSRVPMTDWYDTVTGRRQGFQARPVVGGVFLQMLYDQDLWAKYAKRDLTRATNWAPMPKPPRFTTLVPCARDATTRWRHTTNQPPPGWFLPDFNDEDWAEDVAGFGTRGTPGAIVGTEWNTSEIWLRRRFDLPELTPGGGLQLLIHHDEDAAIYLNGQLVLELQGYTTGYEAIPLSREVQNALRPMGNVIAIHCRQTTGGQYIDAGLQRLEQEAAP